MLRGVALFLSNSTGEMFVVRERQSKPKIGKIADMISIPMETIEPGESPEAALERLLREEIGLAIMSQPIQLAWARFAPVDHPEAIPYEILVFVAQVDGSRPAVPLLDPEDVEPAGWMSLSQLANLGPKGRRELPGLLLVLQRCR